MPQQHSHDHQRAQQHHASGGGGSSRQAATVSTTSSSGSSRRSVGAAARKGAAGAAEHSAAGAASMYPTASAAAAAAVVNPVAAAAEQHSQQQQLHIKRCDLCAYGCRGEKLYTPVRSCEIEPVVILGKGQEAFDDDDLVALQQASDQNIRIFYRWRRGPARAVCFFHPNYVARLQCSVSLRCFCSYPCFFRGQAQLRRFYASGGRVEVPRQANEFSYGVPCERPSIDDDNREPDSLHYSLLSSAGLLVGDDGDDVEPSGAATDCQSSGTAESSAASSHAAPVWTVVSYSRCYSPTAQDVGHQLAFEVAVDTWPSGQQGAAEVVNFWSQFERSAAGVADGDEGGGGLGLGGGGAGLSHRCYASVVTACVVPQAPNCPRRLMIATGVQANGMRLNIQRIIRPGSPVALSLGIGVRWSSTAQPAGAPPTGPTVQHSDSGSRAYGRLRLESSLGVDATASDFAAKAAVAGSNAVVVADAATTERIRFSRVALLTEQRFRLDDRGLPAGDLHEAEWGAGGGRPATGGGGAAGTVPGAPAPSVASTATNHGFTVMTWNVLADIYVTFNAFPHAPGFVLAWNYRKDRILAEILAYDPDIICLQEVQGDHFEDFFAPALLRRGYEGLYKQKMSGVFRGSGKHRGGRYVNDGCATFFKVPKFRLRDHFAIEFGRVALPSPSGGRKGGNHPAGAKPEGSNRLNRDNVALVLCLEHLIPPANAGPGAATSAATTSASAADPAQNNSHLVSKKIIVANTHILANREAPDVKIWQANTLMTVVTEYVEKCMSTYKLSVPPGLVVCGDFNSMPSSAVYELVSTGRCDVKHEELRGSEACRWLADVPLEHGLSLRSSYGVADYLRSARLPYTTRISPSVNLRQYEPEFTNYTHHFVDCLDYVFFDDRSLAVAATLDIVRERQLLEEAHALQLSDWALPSPQRPSDHIPLMTRFEWVW